MDDTNIKVFFLLLLLSVVCSISYGQKGSTAIDTSYFIIGEDDYNLLYASERGDTTAMKILLARGADPEVKTWEGVTPLMYATESGNLGAVKILIARGVDLDAAPIDETTALIASAKAGYLEIAELLIRNDAAIDTADRFGASPLHYAVYYNDYLLTDMLLYYDADVGIKDKQGTTPLMVATLNSNTEIADLLLLNFANINETDQYGFTPLMLAAEQNDTVMGNYLVANGAEINLQNKKEQTALTIAILNNSAAMTALLLENGADADATINFSDTPYSLAQFSTNDTIKQLLKDYGGKKNYIPRFEYLTVGFDYEVNNDKFISMRTGFRDTKLNSALEIEFGLRPGTEKILVNPKSDLVYQYLERRYLISLNLTKFFILKKYSQSNRIEAFVNADGIFTYGSYRGSTRSAKSLYLFSPGAGLNYHIGFLDLRAGYKYQEFNVYDISPHWLTLGMTFNFGLRKKGFRKPEPYWFD